MRQILECSQAEEHELINKLGIMLRNAGFNASNSTLVAVSSDYSSIAWQILRHFLSHDGEVCEGFTIDVPYPDQVWDDRFARRALDACRASLHRSMSCNQNLILIEAGVIRGSNYRNVVDLIQRHYPQHKVVTTTLFENKGSTFKSDFVVKYYDDETQDLTFWWEAYNKHWPIDIQERKRLASKAVWGSGLGGCGNLGFDPNSVPAPMTNRNQVFHAGLEKAGTASSSAMQIVDEATGSEELARCVGMQGTSMETPRLAGELALLVGWLKRFERVLGVEAKQPEPPEHEVRG